MCEPRTLSGKKKKQVSSDAPKEDYFLFPLSLLLLLPIPDSFTLCIQREAVNGANFVL